MEPTIEWVSDQKRFSNLATEWDRIAAGDALPFTSHAVVSAWWRAFGAGNKLHVGVLWDGSELAAALPLYANERRIHGMVDPEMPRFTPIARDEPALRSVVSAVLRIGAAELVIPRVPVEHPVFPLLVDGSRDAGMLALVEQGHTAPIIELSGDFDDYRRRMRPKWMSRLMSYRRKMLRDFSAELRIVHPPEDLESELENGLILEASGWKGREGTAVLSSPEMASFYSSLAHIFHANHELRLSRIALDGRLVAFDIAVVSRGRLYSLKTAYDEAYRRLSPGLVLRVSVIERCFELGLDAYEFTGPAYGWTQSFATGGREHRLIRIYPRRPLPSLRYVGRKTLAPLVRRIRSRRRERRVLRS